MVSCEKAVAATMFTWTESWMSASVMERNGMCDHCPAFQMAAARRACGQRCEPRPVANVSQRVQVGAKGEP